MAEKYLIEVRLTGEDMTPDRISSRDIGELIAAIEQMIASLVARDNPALGIDESEVIVGLSSIRQGSYVMQFQTPHDDAVIAAYRSVASAINHTQYTDLPMKSIEALKTVRKIAREYRTSAELWEQNGHQVQLATVTSNTQIEIEDTLLSGKTTLYGTVIRVGGENPPRVHLRLLDGSFLNCIITQKEEKLIAKRLGAKLYQQVGIRGTAKWDIRDMSLQAFTVEELTEYSRVPLESALASLRIIAGDYYNNTGNIDKLISDIRGDEEDYDGSLY